MRNFRHCRGLFRGIACIALAFAFSAPADTTATPQTPADQIRLRSTANGSLRRLLDAATGVAAQGSAAATADANDEIYWDRFELCGDGVIDSGAEQCDRSDFGGATCLTNGFTNGTLACDTTCHVDIGGCTGACPVDCTTDADCGICGPCFFNICTY